MFRNKKDKKWFAIIVAVVVCLAVLGTARADWPEQDKLLASDGAADDWFGHSVAISGDTAVIGAEGDDANGGFSGSAYVFRYDGSNWGQEAKLMASDGAAWDLFGASVAISSETTVVGAQWDDDNGDDSGSAYVFRFDGSNWVQQVKLLALDGAAGDRFGYSVAISDYIAVIGASDDDDHGTDSGSAYVFRYDGSSWAQEAKLLASDGAADDWFGYSVAISGDTIVVGAGFDDDNGTDSGSAYVFRYDGSSWIQEAKLLASDGATGDFFGSSVGVSIDTVVIGAKSDNDNGTDSGSGYVFRYDGSSWVQEVKLLVSDGEAGDWFGESVSISADYAIVGASGDDNHTGSAYIFKWDGTSWSQQAKLTASDRAYGDNFGVSVSVSGEQTIAGAFRDNDGGADSGSAYIFKRVCPTADLSGDCFVNFVDFSIMAGQWLQDN